jgi:hypothetical protein
MAPDVWLITRLLGAWCQVPFGCLEQAVGTGVLTARHRRDPRSHESPIRRAPGIRMAPWCVAHHTFIRRLVSGACLKIMYEHRSVTSLRICYLLPLKWSMSVTSARLPQNFEFNREAHFTSLVTSKMQEHVYSPIYSMSPLYRRKCSHSITRATLRDNGTSPRVHRCKCTHVGAHQK